MIVHLTAAQTAQLAKYAMEDLTLIFRRLRFDPPEWNVQLVGDDTVTLIDPDGKVTVVDNADLRSEND